jgi:hypothetical protein
MGATDHSLTVIASVHCRAVCGQERAELLDGDPNWNARRLREWRLAEEC